MAELLVRVADKVPESDPRHLAFLRAGEVVVVCPDGWQWSDAELSNPDWTILKLPGITESQARAMLGGVTAIPGDGKLPIRRAFHLTPSQIAELRALGPAATWSDLESRRTRRPIPADPQVFGAARRIIG